MVADVVAVSPANIIGLRRLRSFKKRSCTSMSQIIAVCGLCDSKEWILAQCSCLHIPGFPSESGLCLRSVDLASSPGFSWTLSSIVLFSEINGAITNQVA